ncbi:GDSL esterase/lipase, partial [Capsicum baccatum]
MELISLMDQLEDFPMVKLLLMLLEVTGSSLGNSLWQKSELLGFDDYIPPYATARGRQILRGVNFASAAAGIREETGQQLRGRISFSGQVNNFKNIVQQIVRIIGDENSAANYLNKCIYSIGVGSNDYLNNYFMPLYYLTSRQYTPQQYANVLIQQYTQQLKVNSNFTGTCVRNINVANQIFNNKLRALVDNLNSNTPDAKLIYINAYGIFPDLIDNPFAF